MQPLRILALSYCFPPMTYPRSIQVARLLSPFASSVKIICGFNPNEQIDDTILRHENNFSDTMRIPFTEGKLSRYASLVDNNRFIPWFNFPDKQRRWVSRALHSCLRAEFLMKHKPDILLTFSTPLSGHFFGLECARRMRVPWIAHFSDPWLDNPYIKKNVLTKLLNEHAEKKVIENADAVIFTSPETIDLVMKKYSPQWREKVFYLPHCLDRALYDSALTPPDNVYVVRSIGNFYGARSPVFLYEAIEQLGERYPDILDKVSFEIAGSLGRLSRVINNFPTAQRVVKLIGSVPYAESIRLMQTSHCLLAIDAPGDYSVFFPSKLVDYIGANRFILALSPPGTTSRVVREVGGTVVNPNDIPNVVEALKNILQQKPARLPFQTHRYDKENVNEELNRIIQYVMHKQEKSG